MAENWEDVVGKHVLFGLTYVDADGTITRRTQEHGVVVSADDEVVRVRLGTGEEFTLPPALEAFDEAEPGEYRLRDTGEVVVNPELIASWTIHSRAEG